MAHYQLRNSASKAQEEGASKKRKTGHDEATKAERDGNGCRSKGKRKNRQKNLEPAEPQPKKAKTIKNLKLEDMEETRKANQEGKVKKKEKAKMNGGKEAASTTAPRSTTTGKTSHQASKNTNRSCTEYKAEAAQPLTVKENEGGEAEKEPTTKRTRQIMQIQASVESLHKDLKSLYAITTRMNSIPRLNSMDHNIANLRGHIVNVHSKTEKCIEEHSRYNADFIVREQRATEAELKRNTEHVGNEVCRVLTEQIRAVVAGEMEKRFAEFRMALAQEIKSSVGK